MPSPVSGRWVLWLKIGFFFRASAGQQYVLNMKTVADRRSSVCPEWNTLKSSQGRKVCLARRVVAKGDCKLRHLTKKFAECQQQ